MNIITDQIIPAGRLEFATYRELNVSIEALIAEIRTLTEREHDLYSEMAEVSREWTCYEDQDEFDADMNTLDAQVREVQTYLSVDAFTLAESIAHLFDRQGASDEPF